MAKTRKDCLTEIAEKSGKSREEVGDALDEILNRAEGYEHDGMGHDEAYARARDEFLQQAADQYARERRGAILDMRKESSRHRYYEATREAIRSLSPKQGRNRIPARLRSKTGRRQPAVSRQPTIGRCAIRGTAPAVAWRVFGRY
jgi:hypothetical protein